MKDPGRPRSSPSTFGPSPETIPWTTSGLGIQYTTATCGVPTPPVTSTFPPNVFQTYPTDDHYGASSPPEIRQPQPRRPYTTIAPNPQSVQKRRRDEEEPQDTPSGTSKRRKRTSSVASADLSEDDRFLVQLKEDENLPWKDIATRFQTEKGKAFQVAALQMRYKRLREKFRVWEDQDVQALKLAHEYWEKYKWEIIGAKVCHKERTILFLIANLSGRCSTSAFTNDGQRAIAHVSGKTWKSPASPMSQPQA